MRRNGFAVLLFHGNYSTLDGLGAWAQFYIVHGFHVLLLTMRGYGLSTGDGGKDGEGGMYLDASAGVVFLQDRNFAACNILAHGFSLGGALAAAAACQYNLGGLTLDHSFTCITDVAEHWLPQIFPVPKWLVGAALKGAYTCGAYLCLSLDGGFAG